MDKVSVLSERSTEAKEIRRMVFFLCCVFAPLWGVGIVIPFLLALVFSLLKDYPAEEMQRLFSAHRLFPIFMVFILFLCSVFFSSLYHTESKWGSTEGFWVVLSAFLFFVLGAVIGAGTEKQRLLLYLKIYFFLGFLLVFFTIVAVKKYNGGIWGNRNDLTAAVLMIVGALCGIFCGDIKKKREMVKFLLLIPLVAFAFYFSVKVTASDAALPLLIGFFFFLSILVPGRYAFTVLWFFFLMIVCFGIAYLVFGEPFNFQALLSARRLESFLSFRPQSWLASLTMVQENPWTGIGSGLYKEFYKTLLPLLPGKKAVLSHSHCMYLVHFVAHGVVGGLAFISLLAFNLRMVFSSMKDGELAPFALLTAGIWFFFLTYGLVELTPASRELVPLVWGSSGILAGLHSKAAARK